MPCDSKPPTDLVTNEERRISAFLFVMAPRGALWIPLLPPSTTHYATVREGYTMIVHVDIKDCVTKFCAKFGVDTDEIFLFQNYTEGTQQQD